MVVALNMCDLVRKNGDKVDPAKLSVLFGCPVVEVSALRGEGVDKLVAAAKKAAADKTAPAPDVHFSDQVEKALQRVEQVVGPKAPTGSSAGTPSRRSRATRPRSRRSPSRLPSSARSRPS